MVASHARGTTRHNCGGHQRNSAQHHWRARARLAQGIIMPGKLDGRVSIVTAGGAGIGAATVRRFAAEGAAVVVADLSGTRAQAVTEGIKSGGGRAVFIKMDAADHTAS